MENAKPMIQPVLNTIDQPPTSPLYIHPNQLLKRGFDLLFSLFVIVGVFLWFYPLIAILIKLDSKGPVLFRQKRHGKNNRVFWCLKFRTMTNSSSSDFQQASKEDPRVTWVGKWLRKTSLDELPQFINVLLGDMSVVGPRPHPVELNNQFEDLIHNYDSRHWIKPGITGLAQANNYRGETKTIQLMQTRVDLDRYYITKWTFMMDMKIIIKTIILMVKGSDRAF